MLSPVEPPLTDEKYPLQKQPEENSRWSHYHPTNLAKEKRLLQWYCDRHPLKYYPTERRSKYFPDMWKDWIESNVSGLERVFDEYPMDGIPHQPDSILALSNSEKYDNRFSAWLRDLLQEKHPYAEAWFYRAVLKTSDAPKSKGMWEYYQSNHSEILAKFSKRVEQIDQIEAERHQEQERYQRDLAQYREQTASPISQQVLLLSRYESHIAKQLKEAFGFAMPSANAQLQSIQEDRKHKESMIWLD